MEAGQVMQKQVRLFFLFFYQIRKRREKNLNVFQRKKEMWKVQRKVRTKQNDGVKEELWKNKNERLGEIKESQRGEM